MERFSKIFPIQFSSEKKSHVKFSMTTNQKEIVMQLTKDENPLFFYTHRMVEDEFRQFKLQQDLKVDFSNFPQMIISLLESVLENDSKFYLTFDDNNASSGDNRKIPSVLKIVQSAGHKDLTHLALKFLPADSRQIQAYLSDTIVHLKRRLSVLEKQNRQLEADNRRQYQSLDEILTKKSDDLAALRKEHEDTVGKLKDEAEREKQELRRTLEHERVELEERCVSLEEENRHLRDQLQGSSADVESVREEFQNLNDEVGQLRQRLEDYRREVIELEKVRNELQTRLESAEDDAESKEIELEQMKDRFQALLDQKRQLEHSLHEWTNRAEKFEDLYNVQCQETEKAVQIMHKCVNYSNSVKDKGTKAELIARKQQELLKNRESELAKLRSENERLTKEVENFQKENKTVSEMIDDLRRQMQEQAGSLAEKEAIIMHMGKQVGEFRLLVNPGRLPSSLNVEERVGSLKTLPTMVNGCTGKENKTPFLHPKYSARS